MGESRGDFWISGPAVFYLHKIARWVVSLPIIRSYVSMSTCWHGSVMTHIDFYWRRRD